MQAAETAISVEIRTVNHRFAEYSIRIPREWLMLEDEVRQLLNRQVRRGKADVFVAIQRAKSSDDVQVDWNLLGAAMEAERALCERLGEPFPVSQVRDWLKYPNVLRVDPRSDVTEAEKSLLKNTVEGALEALVAMRQREGKRMEGNLLEKLDRLRQYALEVRDVDSEMVETRSVRLKERALQLQVEVDPDRLAQEVVFLVDRSAIDEEIVRFLIHIEAFGEALTTPGVIGRRLDFVVQEMHREVNTIGSKAVDPRITRAVVEMKVLVEQLREQVQNVE